MLVTLENLLLLRQNEFQFYKIFYFIHARTYVLILEVRLFTHLQVSFFYILDDVKMKL